jgi:hypothetical protein
MVFEKIRTKVRGRLQEIRNENAKVNAANKIIKERATAAALREKQKQEIKFAEERQKYIYEKKIKKMKQPAGGFFSGFEGVNSYGTPAGRRKVVGSQKVIIYKKGKKGKRRKIVTNKPQASSYSFGGLVEQQGRYNVLGY